MSGPRYPRHEIADFVVGFESSRDFAITRDELDRFSAVSGDEHPLHTDLEFSKQRGYPGAVVHGMLAVSRCSAFLAFDFVGSHGLLVALAADFRQPVYCGETLHWRAEVTKITTASGILEICWQVTKESNKIAQRGTACAWLPPRS